MRQLAKQYGVKKSRGRMLRWQDNGTGGFECARVRVRRFWLTRHPPAFATTMESPVLNERARRVRRGRSETARRKPRAGRRAPIQLARRNEG